MAAFQNLLFNRRVKAPKSLAERVRLALLMLLGLLALCGAVFIGAGVNQFGLVSLVDNRLTPLRALQQVTGDYEQALGVANKVRSGNLTPAGGKSALNSLQSDIAAGWKQLEADVPAQAGGVKWELIQHERAQADEGLKQLCRLLANADTDGLDFFLSGTFYTHIDPLLTASSDYMDGIQHMAEHEQFVLQAVAGATQLIMVFVILAGAGIAWYLYRLARRQIVEPLVEISGFTARSGFESGERVPHSGRQDEIGDIARSILTAQERTIEARRVIEQKHEAEAARRRQDHATAEAARQRAGELESIFARFGADMADMTGNLVLAARSLREMAQSMTETSGSSQELAMTASEKAQRMLDTMTDIERSSSGLAALGGEVAGAIGSARDKAARVYGQSQANRAHAHHLRDLLQQIYGALDLIDRKSTRLNSSHTDISRMPSSA